MSNQLTVIHQQEVLGRGFKVYGTTEEPLFLAKDVAEWIEYGDKNTYRLLNNVDEDEKITCSTQYGGQLREMHFLTEGGIYEVLMTSRKPIAKQWKKEVKKILKNIRLNGGHVQVDREEEFIHSHFPSFSEEVKKAMVLDLREQNKQLQAVEVKEDISTVVVLLLYSR
ncbi:Bro-N domain-containing protein [Bacillus mycoides]|uniref:BRO-N domain-containing protein n=1 Tax=Bacillus mycoides TaxID=1405 RepID=UPI0025A0F3F5|nr:Bro-N domain-containing protein [Bacillus mycoides]MDM5426713.1 Bro-N domain-containing protein [Bacillus mycoides]MED1012605.1 Bro-N domain-containing protein [Bacillus mycoides]MED1052650.1 Bro-N domain-containing protein [Bacillus mycoides]